MILYFPHSSTINALFAYSKLELLFLHDDLAPEI